MNGNETTAQWEDRFEEEAPQIANMDEIDFLTLLMESRIIQASSDLVGSGGPYYSSSVQNNSSSVLPSARQMATHRRMVGL